jgi:hypothetical protein
LEKDVDEDGTSRNVEGMGQVPSRALDIPHTAGPMLSYLALSSIQAGHKLRERALDGAELVLGGPWKRQREKQKRAGWRQGKAGCSNEWEGVGSGGGNGG